MPRFVWHRTRPLAFVRNTYRVVVHISWMIYSIRSAILSLFRNPISFQFYSGRTWRRIQVRMKICWMALSNIYDDESGYFFFLSLYSCRLLRKHHSSNSAQSPRNSSKQKKKLSYHSGLCCMEVAHRLLVSDYKQILSSNWNCCLPHTLHNPCQTLYRPLCFFFHYHQQHQHQRRIIIIDCHSHSCISAETKFMDGISLNYWPANNNARGGDSAPASPH